MESLRKEENELFQGRAAHHLSHLMNLVLDRNPCPIPKIIQNLTSFLCSDGDFTPPIDDQTGILSLSQLNFGTGGSSTGNAESVPGGDGTKKSSGSSGTKKSEDPTIMEEKKMILIQRRGATCALSQIVEFFGIDLPTKVGKLLELTFVVLQTAAVDGETNNQVFFFLVRDVKSYCLFFRDPWGWIEESDWRTSNLGNDFSQVPPTALSGSKFDLANFRISALKARVELTCFFSHFEIVDWKSNWSHLRAPG